MYWLYVGLAVALGCVASLWLRGHGYRLDDDVVHHTLNPWWVPVVSGLGALAAAPFAAHRPRVVILTYLLALVWAVVLAFIDLEVRRLPDRVMWPGYLGAAVLLVACSAATHDWAALLRAVTCAGAATLVMFVLAFWSPFGADSLGYGDVKLAGVLGALFGWFGWMNGLMGFLAGFILAGLGGLLLVVARRATLKSDLAYGPGLLAGAYLCCVLSLAL